VGGRAVGGSHTVGRGWGRREGPAPRSGETGESGARTGGPQLQFRVAIKFNLK
jgi:hypothetical protein